VPQCDNAHCQLNSPPLHPERTPQSQSPPVVLQQYYVAAWCLLKDLRQAFAGNCKKQDASFKAGGDTVNTVFEERALFVRNPKRINTEALVSVAPQLQEVS
jgi:hypothetical protein